MGIGASIFFLAVGAILAFAVEVEAEGFDVNTVGVILIVVGAIGLLLSFAFWNSWGGWGGYRRGPVVTDRAPSDTVVMDRRPRQTVVVDDDAPVVVDRSTRRRTIIEE